MELENRISESLLEHTSNNKIWIRDKKKTMVIKRQNILMKPSSKGGNVPYIQDKQKNTLDSLKLPMPFGINWT